MEIATNKSSNWKREITSECLRRRDDPVQVANSLRESRKHPPVLRLSLGESLRMPCSGYLPSGWCARMASCVHRSRTQLSASGNHAISSHPAEGFRRRKPLSQRSVPSSPFSFCLIFFFAFILIHVFDFHGCIVPSFSVGISPWIHRSIV